MTKFYFKYPTTRTATSGQYSSVHFKYEESQLDDKSSESEEESEEEEGPPPAKETNTIEHKILDMEEKEVLTCGMCPHVYAFPSLLFYYMVFMYSCTGLLTDRNIDTIRLSLSNNFIVSSS